MKRYRVSVILRNGRKELRASNLYRATAEAVQLGLDQMTQFAAVIVQAQPG